jgi:hypothetical protein
MIWETALNTRFAKDMRLMCVEITQMLEARAYPNTQRPLARCAMTLSSINAN